MRIVITVPDDFTEDDRAIYVEHVSEQIRDGYISGHIDRDYHWTTEGS